MGCDIHIVIEKKVNDKWLGVYASDIIDIYPNEPKGNERWYLFFDKLAGVRQRGSIPQNTTKGFPDDLSELGYYISQEMDGHSPSYCSAKEFCDFYNASELELIVDKPIKSSSVKILGLWESDLEDYRVVFYFDN